MIETSDLNPGNFQLNLLHSLNNNNTTSRYSPNLIMTNPAPSQPYDVTANHVELLLTNVRLSVNPLLLKYRTPFFIMTPSNCDG